MSPAPGPKAKPCHTGFGVGDPAKPPIPSLRGTLANAIIDGAHDYPGDLTADSFRATLEDIETGRWSIDAGVLAMAATLRISLQQICMQFERTVRLPHGTLWIEFNPTAEIGSGYLSDASRLGVLITKGDGTNLNFLFATWNGRKAALARFNAQIGSNCSTAELTPLPTLTKDQAMLADRYIDEMRPFITGQIEEVLKVLIVCTAPRCPITFMPAEDYTKINKARAKRKDAPHVANQPVRWNATSRQEALPATDSESDGGDSGRHVRLHMQRGHFKVTKHGVFWWSYHFRGKGGGELAKGRDHKVSGNA